MSDFNNLAFAATESRPLISSLSTLGLTRQPDNLREMFDFYPMQTDIGHMAALGRYRQVEAESGDIYHHEKAKIIEGPTINTSATVAQVYGVGSGNITSEGKVVSVTGIDYIQIDPSSHTPSNGSDAGKYSYPRVGDTIQFTNLAVWYVYAKDEANANAHRLYIVKMDSSYPALSATIPLVGGVYGGTRFSIIGDAWEERTEGRQSGLVSAYSKYAAYLQTFTDKYEITDQAENVKMIEMKVGGKMVKFHYEIGLSDTEERFMFKEALGLFVTPRSNVTLPDGKIVETTQGFIPALEASAKKLYYSSTPTIELFYEINRQKRKLYQRPESHLYFGQEFGNKTTTFLADFIKDTGTSYSTDGKAISDIDLNFQTIKLAGHTYKMRELEILSHADTLGLDGMPYQDYFFVIPTNPTKDPKSGKLNYPFTMLYAPTKGMGARGHYKIFEKGYNSQHGTGERYNREIHLYSRKGTQVAGARQIIFGKPA